MSTVTDLLKGSIDIHVHFGPDPRWLRSVDALMAAREARDAGMRAIVLNSNDYPTAGVAYTVSQVVDGIALFGCICLDSTVGGLNVEAVEVAASLKTKIVGLPTFTSANERKKKGLTDGVTIIDGAGKLVPEMKKIFSIIKKNDMVLATGYVSAEEVFAAVDGAKAAGITRIVITHPLLKHVGPALNVDQMNQLADKGAYIEHCFAATMPAGARMDPMEIVDAVRKVGAERTILSTDFGREHHPKPAEGFRVMIGTLLKCGLTGSEMEMMIKRNPARLLGRD